MIATKAYFNNVVCCFGFVAMAVAGLSSAVNAAEPESSERARIMTEIDKELKDEKGLQAAIRAGQERSVLCANCHGVDGNSVRPDIPNLAEQNTTYIIDQIGKFVDGRRKHFVMPILARDFTFQDKVNLAVYYTSQKLKPVEANPKLAAIGEPLYKNLCFSCHGVDGRGEAGYALVAGQKIDYVKNTLKRFRANASKTGDLASIKRSDVSMEQATVQLSDADIEGLAHYSALMQKQQPGADVE